MVTLTISVNAHSSKRNELLSSYRLIVDQTRQEKGYLGCRLAFDIDNEKRIYLDETWESRTRLDAHLRSDIFSALLGSVRLLGETYAIQINECSRTDGLEAVQAARSMKA